MSLTRPSPPLVLQATKQWGGLGTRLLKVEFCNLSPMQVWYHSMTGHQYYFLPSTIMTTQCFDSHMQADLLEAVLTDVPGIGSVLSSGRVGVDTQLRVWPSVLDSMDSDLVTYCTPGWGTFMGKLLEN